MGETKYKRMDCFEKEGLIMGKKKTIFQASEKLIKPHWHYIEDGEWPKDESTCWVACYLTINGSIAGTSHMMLMGEPLYYYQNENGEPIWLNNKAEETFLPIRSKENDKIVERQWVPYAWAYAILPDIQIPYKRFCERIYGLR